MSGSNTDTRPLTDVRVVPDKRKKAYVPDDWDPTKEILKHFTPQQVFDILNGAQFVKNQTGHGSVTIEIRKGLPRHVLVTYGADLDP